MRALFNDFLRWYVGHSLVFLGHLLRFSHRKKIKNFVANQKSLRENYQIQNDTPLSSYGQAMEESLQDFSQKQKEVDYALTSGSTSSPKKIPYTPKRVKRVKQTFIDVFARAYAAHPPKRHALYVFSAISQDQSLTGMLLEEPKLPFYLAGLQAPYRVQNHPDVHQLTQVYGATAIRLWVISLSNPGVLYSTNPSTLSTFLDQIESDWETCHALIRDFVEKPKQFKPSIHRIAQRICSRGYQARLQQLAQSSTALSFDKIAPKVEAISCWTGGYVQPFIDRVRIHLPAAKYRIIPMYSMSTETIETITDFRDQKTQFLPLAEDVLYEFLPEGENDEPDKLVGPLELEIGQSYTMVVSDPYGLRRYQTEDLFECKGKVEGLPDLHFLRRRALEYSFTGEKITAVQLSATYKRLREEISIFSSDTFITLMPSTTPMPHYKLIVVDTDISGAKEEIEARFDVLLGEQNDEYDSKRKSDRLGRPELLNMSLEELVRRTVNKVHEGSWESQFKFLPLYRRTWEESEAISPNGDQ